MKNHTCRVAWTMVVLALTAIHSLAQSTYEPYTFTTLAGNTSGDGTGSAARFGGPIGVTVDRAGNVYVADASNGTIRKVTAAGVVTTLAGLVGKAGSADGTGSAARFNDPVGLAVDSAGNVYVADAGNNTIRKVTPTGMVTTLAGLAQFDVDGNPVGGSADGTGSAGRFNQPQGVAVDSTGNVYVTDTYNNTIRKVTAEGVVTTLAGLAQFDNNGRAVGGSADGTGIEARFNIPLGAAVDSAGNVYVSDRGNNTIRKVTPTGVVTTLAGLASSSVAIDSAGNIYVALEGNGTIRKVTAAGVVTTLAGLAGSIGSADGTGSTAQFYFPEGVAVDTAGNVYVADFGNKTIRKVTPTGVVTTLAGLAGSSGNSGSEDGTGSAARFNQPYGVAVDSASNVYVADYQNNTIRKVTSAGVVTTLAGLAGSTGSADGTGSSARFNSPTGVAVDSAGNVYVAEYGNHTIRKVTSAGVVTTLAGLAGTFGSTDATGSNARFYFPEGVAVDSAGNVYVADTFNQRIRKVTPEGVVTTLAGIDAQFNYPTGVAVDSAGNVYVADLNNNAIRKVTTVGVVTTLAGVAGVSGSADGTGSDARFNYPNAVAVDSAGNVYVADSHNYTIRKVTPEGVVTTLAGLARMGGSADGTGSDARFGYELDAGGPSGVAVDSAGNVYVADQNNNTIREGYVAPRILNSGPGFGFNGGQFGFSVTGPAGRLAVVETSTDLMSWLPLWTNTFAGALNFRDPQSGVSSHRFYRAHLP